MDELPVINQTYEVYKELVELNDKLSKRWRYSLGLSLETSVLELLRELLMAKSAPKSLKAGYLIKATALQELLTLKIRLLLELKLAPETKIFQTQAKLTEIGRMIGGWRKASQTVR